MWGLKMGGFGTSEGVGGDFPINYVGEKSLDLVFTEQRYYIYEYAPLDASLNLDFVNQTYQSE
ncbi:MAG: hypothetical protein RI906_1105 [Pseudomonadota bacterium]|jgi:hypothetical protein